MRCVPASAFLLPTLLLCQVHKSPFAGTWYPGDAAELRKMLDHSFGLAEKRTGGAPPRQSLRALLVPHAGIAYSGSVAAASYRLLGRAKNVIVLGFSHRRPLAGVFASDVESYGTPLGSVLVNREVVRSLAFPLMREDRLCDHSLEIQIPFLQRVAPEAKLVPLYVGELGPAELKQAGLRLAKRMELGDVVIASSDLTHYGKDYGYTPFPNDRELPRRLFERAMAGFEELGSLNVASFDRYLAETGDTICGRGPIRLMMTALTQLSGEIYMTPIDYLSSGELVHDYSTSVSYGAAAFYPASAFGVGEAGKKKLIESARRTLDSFLATGRKQPIPAAVDQTVPELAQKTGLFVTIRKVGQLRGCIGALLSRTPLSEAVADRTLAAATEDPRFPPLTAKEGPLSLEISLLTPARRIGSWKEFRVGQGAILLLDGKSGLLLPQVAAEQGWNAEQFLENLSLKAGLPPKSYRDPRSAIHVFSAQVFGDETVPRRIH